MANLDESAAVGYDWGAEGVYRIEKSDPVEGGPDGISNRQAEQLARRTRNLHERVEEIEGDGWVTTQKIADLSVTGDKIAKDTIDTSNIADEAITAVKIAVGAVTASKVATNAIGASKVQTKAISLGKIGDDVPLGFDYVVYDDVTLSGLASTNAKNVFIKRGIYTKNSKLAVSSSVEYIEGAMGATVTINSSDPNPDVLFNLGNALSSNVAIRNVKINITQSVPLTAVAIGISVQKMYCCEVNIEFSSSSISNVAFTGVNCCKIDRTDVRISGSIGGQVVAIGALGQDVPTNAHGCEVSISVYVGNTNNLLTTGQLIAYEYVDGLLMSRARMNGGSQKTGTYYCSRVFLCDMLGSEYYGINMPDGTPCGPTAAGGFNT
jgi:hypothetical protein